MRSTGKTAFARGFHDQAKSFMKAAKIAIFSGALLDVMNDVGLAKGIAVPSADQQATFDNLVWKYRNAYVVHQRGGDERIYMEALQRALGEYLNAIGASDNSKAAAFRLLEQRMAELP